MLRFFFLQIHNFKDIFNFIYFWNFQYNSSSLKIKINLSTTLYKLWLAQSDHKKTTKYPTKNIFFSHWSIHSVAISEKEMFWFLLQILNKIIDQNRSNMKSVFVEKVRVVHQALIVYLYACTHSFRSFLQMTLVVSQAGRWAVPSPVIQRISRQIVCCKYRQEFKGKIRKWI